MSTNFYRWCQQFGENHGRQRGTLIKMFFLDNNFTNCKLAVWDVVTSKVIITKRTKQC